MSRLVFLKLYATKLFSYRVPVSRYNVHTAYIKNENFKASPPPFQINMGVLWRSLHSASCVPHVGDYKFGKCSHPKKQDRGRLPNS